VIVIVIVIVSFYENVIIYKTYSKGHYTMKNNIAPLRIVNKYKGQQRR
jgi:hypothetical protein